jgi:membrane-bound lytic murein transglycosylase D
MNYYKEHNLKPVTSAFPKKVDTLMIQESLHLQQVAQVLKVPIDQLRDLNPQYVRDIIPATANVSYPLMLPDDQVNRFIDYQDSIYAFKDSIYFNPEALKKQPELYSHRGKKLSKRMGDLTLIHYIVKQGDNLGLISEWYNCRVNDILDWNNMYSNRIRSGQKLAIYVPEKSVSKYKKINSMSLKQKQLLRTGGIDALAEQNTEESSKVVETKTQDTKASSKSQTIYYTVKEGDTLWGIAKKYPGISDIDIRRWNNISRNQSIVPGQQLVIKVM